MSLIVCLQRAHNVSAETVHRAGSGQRHQLHLALLARFEAHCGAGGDIQAIAGRLLAIELQRRVDLGEVVMRADLNRPVAVIFNDNAAGGAADVNRYLAGFYLIFSRDHRATSDYRVMDGNQLRAVREGGFDTDIGDHFRHAFHDRRGSGRGVPLPSARRRFCHRARPP